MPSFLVRNPVYRKRRWLVPSKNAGTLTITTPVTMQARQISSSSDLASIPITGTYTGSPTAIEASFNGGAYATIDAAPAGGTFSGTLSNQAAGQGTLTVRFTNNTSISSTVTLITLTDVFIVGGDSRASGRFTNKRTYSGTGTPVVFRQDDAWASADEGTTGVSSDNDGASTATICPLFASIYSSHYGRPPAFITCGTGSTDVGPSTGSHKEWTKGQSAYTEMSAQYTAAATGGIKTGLMFFGPNALADIPTLAAYNSSIDQFLGDFASDFNTSQVASPKCIIDICGEVGTTGLSAANLRLAEDHVRGAIQLAYSDNSQLAGIYFLMEQNYADNVHPKTNAEADTVVRRLWMAWHDAHELAVYGRGPRVSSTARINAGLDTITISVDRDLASGTTYGGFRVTDSGVAATISSVTRTDARTITIVLSAATSAAVNTLWSFASNDDAVGQTIPTSIALTLPDTNTEVLPMETVIDAAVTQTIATPLFVYHLQNQGMI